ncbi:MAG: hypothetical protein ABJA57_07390 [Ginsengibacter sp.]
MKANFIHRYQQYDLLLLMVYGCIIFLFLLATGTFFSGFHLIDDQTYILLNAKYHSSSFLYASYHAVKEDLFLRFRPLSMIYYVAIAKWIYPSFTGIALVLALQGIFSCYFFYRFARMLNAGIMLSFLFPLFILAGNQGVIFWRNCMSETLCMLLISIALFYVVRLLKEKNGSKKWNVFVFAVFLLLSTFVKESFIILVPAILFFKIWQEASNNKISWLASFKRNLPLVIFFSLVIVSEISIVYYYKKISDHFIEYVSIDQDTFKPYNLLVSLFRLLITKGYFIAIVPAFLLIVSWRKKTGWHQEIKQFFLPLFVLFLLIVIPQVILYSKSLIFERYLLPGTLSSGFLVLYLQKYMDVHRHQLKWLPAMFLPFCIAILLLQITLMTRDATRYAKDGNDVKTALKTIIENTNPGDTILVVAQPKGQSEPALSVKAYLTAEIGGFRKNVFIEPVVDSTLTISKTEASDVKNFLEMTRGTRYNNIINKSSIRCVLFFENVRDIFLLNHPEVDTIRSRHLGIGRFNIYIQKKNINS